jgi:predicted aldo/keto reductase-like oxidoreductase
MDCESRLSDVSRRTFIKAGMATAAAVSMPVGARAQEEGEETTNTIPRRILGTRTGESVTMLNLGTTNVPERRILNAAYSQGIRYLDTAKSYGNGASEKAIADWFSDKGKRKEFFLVTKDHPETPHKWMESVDARLESLKTDYIDALFLHGLGAGFGGDDKTVLDWPKSKEWAEAGKKVKQSGKVRFLGFSTHAKVPLRIELLNNAAKGGWVEAIMFAYDPKTVRENKEFNQAIDACHKAGIGLICMKEMRAAENAGDFLPEFTSMGLSPHEAVLHAVWTDERFASICSKMPNLKILEENCNAARKFKPLDSLKLGSVLKLYGGACATFCNACDGSCQKAGKTGAALNDITRYLTYYERDGMRDEARRLYRALPPEERDWRGADLQAASRACRSNLDFATLLKRAEDKLA